MQVMESRRNRQLIIRLDRGDELPAGLVRALSEAEAKSAWVEGIGSLEAAEIAIFDQRRRDYHTTRRIDSPSELVSMSGNIASIGGSLQLRLSATLARETEIGLEHLAGQLVWARAYSVELRVTVFEDVTLTRSIDERTGLPTLGVTSSALPHVAAAAPAVAAPPVEPPKPMAPAAHERSPALPLVAPVRLVRPQEEPESYPDVGDAVTHFHFGDCTIISSDGERIRLRQDRDGRVREVSLTMLKIQSPTTDPETGQRRFQLLRKN